MSHWSFRPYVPVAKRRAQAEKEMLKLKKKGGVAKPIVVEGRAIAKNFWGKSWCDNLERYSDYENRLPRGRTYVRNGSVIDLKIERGKVEALVSGSEIYKVKIDIAIAAVARWKALCAECAGSVGSLVELLQGKLSKTVMERVCRESDGLFPTPREIKMSCSCPDGAAMCKHVAATLYGVGARLDGDPDLLFALRGVDRAELIASVGAVSSATRSAENSERVLADDDVAALFGLEMEARVTAARETKKLAPAAKSEPAKKPRAIHASPPALAVKAKSPEPAPKRRRPTVAPPAVDPRRPEPEPPGRTRASKWIGARTRKAGQ